MRQVDIVAVADGLVAGMVIGVAVAVTSSLVGDPDSPIVGGSMVGASFAASFVASWVTKSRSGGSRPGRW